MSHLSVTATFYCYSINNATAIIIAFPVTLLHCYSYSTYITCSNCYIVTATILTVRLLQCYSYNNSTSILLLHYIYYIVTATILTVTMLQL